MVRRLFLKVEQSVLLNGSRVRYKYLNMLINSLINVLPGRQLLMLFTIEIFFIAPVSEDFSFSFSGGSPRRIGALKVASPLSTNTVADVLWI